jgi:hypothetical protein
MFDLQPRILNKLYGGIQCPECLACSIARIHRLLLSPAIDGFAYFPLYARVPKRIVEGIPETMKDEPMPLPNFSCL